MKAPNDIIRKLPDVKTLATTLNEERGDVLKRAFPVEDVRRGTLNITTISAVIDAGSVMDEDVPPLEAVAFGINVERTVEPRSLEDLTRSEFVELGTRAVNRLADEGPDADFSPTEMSGLEAIVQICGRPAILIQDGRFFPPPMQWQVLESFRGPIENNMKSIGRIEVEGHPSLEWLGTGFLVSPTVIMTNRHVAKEFCRLGMRRRWGFEPQMKARIDYVEEFGALETAEFDITSVIGIHETLDMALLRVEKFGQTGMKAPDPLTVAAMPPDGLEGRQVYSIGYPAWDGRRNDPDVMRKIFSNIFDVKRLQPGEIMHTFPDQPIFMHDCSTLGGNSGSSVIDLQTGKVLGLHFGGRYREGNYAVALWQVREDPLVKKAKINYE